MKIAEIMSGPCLAMMGGDQSRLIVEPLRPVPLPNRAGAAAQGWNIRLEQWQRRRKVP